MDRYQRVEKPRTETPINHNEIRITTQGLIRNYISYATTLFQEKNEKEIILKAMGQAISKTVAIAEILKKRNPRLHQNTAMSSVSITDVWEPMEEGLVPVEMTRHVSMISITLSTSELDKNSPGYQAPVNVEQPRAQQYYQKQQQPQQARAPYNGYNDDSYGRGRGRGSGRGRGRGWRGGYDNYQGGGNKGYGNYQGGGRGYDNYQGGGRGYDNYQGGGRGYDNYQGGGRGYDNYKGGGRGYDNYQGGGRGYENYEGGGRRYDNYQGGGGRGYDNYQGGGGGNYEGGGGNYQGGRNYQDNGGYSNRVRGGARGRDLGYRATTGSERGRGTGGRGGGYVSRGRGGGGGGRSRGGGGNQS